MWGWTFSFYMWASISFDSQVVSKWFMSVYVNKDVDTKYALEEKCHKNDKQLSPETYRELTGSGSDTQGVRLII